MRKCVFLLVLLVLFSGCGGGKKLKFTEEELAEIPFPQREGLPEVSGGFVLAVSGETITSDEVVTPLVKHFRPIAQASDFEQFKRQVSPELERIVVGRISNILLYNEAKKDAGEQIDEALEKAVEAEVRTFVVSFGGDYAKAEKALKQDGLDWASFREYQKKMIMSQSYIASQLPGNKPITYSELMACYNEMKEESFVIPAAIKFRLIDIEPAKLRAADPNQDRLEQARKLANKLLAQAKAGKDFAELAEQYSQEQAIVWRVVEVSSLQSLSEPYNALAVQIEKINPGDVPEPVETPEHILIMKLEEKRPKSYQPFEKVQHRVEEKIIFDRRRKAADKLGAKLVQQAGLGNKDEFVAFCVRKIYRMCNQ